MLATRSNNNKNRQGKRLLVKRKEMAATTRNHQGAGFKGEKKRRIDLDLGDEGEGRASTPLYTTNMHAHKHHCLVCLYTPQYSSINVNPHNLSTKLPPSNATTHNLPTKLLPLTHNMTPNKVSLKNATPPNKLPLPNNNKSPPKATSKIAMHSTYNKIAIATHTTQHHTHKGKQNYLYLPLSKHIHQKKPKIQQQTIHKLTFKKILSPTHAPPHNKIKQPPHQIHTKNHTNNHKTPQSKPTHPRLVNHTLTPNYPKTSKPTSTQTRHNPQLKSDPQRQDAETHVDLHTTNGQKPQILLQLNPTYHQRSENPTQTPTYSKTKN